MIADVLKIYVEFRKTLGQRPGPNDPRKYDVDYLYLHGFDSAGVPLIAALLTIATVVREGRGNV